MPTLNRSLLAWIPGLAAWIVPVFADAQPSATPYRISDDAPERIRFLLDPIPLDRPTGPIKLVPVDDTVKTAAAPELLRPPVTSKEPISLLPLPRDLAIPSLSLAYPFTLNTPESISVEAKVILDFPEYWAGVEARDGMDELRRQLGMAPASGQGEGTNPLVRIIDGRGGVNFLAAGSALYQAFKQRNLELERLHRFQAKVDGLMEYAHGLGTVKHSGPAISIILARLDFMKRKAAGKLPARPERIVFTEPLRAWAVNPVFDSTRLGAPLLDICRMYEEMTN